MIKGQTKSGFAYEIDEQCMNDMNMLEALSETMENPLAFAKVCTMLLGKEQKAKFYEHLKDENGRVPVNRVSEEVAEIFNEMGEVGKNS